MWLALLVGCIAQNSRADCGKVLCGTDEYCLHDDDAIDSGAGFVMPNCTTAPDACDGTPSCGCLTECTSCTEEDGLVRCHIGG